MALTDKKKSKKPPKEPAEATDTPKAPRSETPRLRRSIARINRNNWWHYLLGALAVAYLLLALIFGVGIYRGGWSGEITRSVSRIIPFPVGWVKGSPVSYAEFLDDVESIKHYYSSTQKVDFASQDGKTRLESIKKQVWDQKVEGAIVTAEARKREIKVEEKDVQAEYQKIADANGGESKVKEILQQYYNWDIPEFKKRIHEQLLSGKVQEAIQNDAAVAEAAKKRIDEVAKELKAGGDFAQLAQKYSEDTSAAQGGDLGFAGRGKYVAEFEKVAYELAPNQISDPVKTEFGYHIIQLLEKRGDEVHVRHILIKVRDFQAWLAEQKKNVKPWIKLPETT